MLTGSWFEIRNPHNDISRLSVVMKGKAYNLNQDDIEYLGTLINSHAIGSNKPPFQVGYMLYGDLIIISNEEWREFVDGLQSTGALGGGCAFAAPPVLLDFQQ